MLTFKWRHVKKDIILMTVRWYLSYSLSYRDIEELMAPFKRGSNTKMIGGHGLGLTIVSTIASMHGGTLTFEPGANGLLAKLTIQRY